MRIHNFLCDPRDYNTFSKWPVKSFRFATSGIERIYLNLMSHPDLFLFYKYNNSEGSAYKHTSLYSRLGSSV